jgi:hypothetical protein
VVDSARPSTRRSAESVVQEKLRAGFDTGWYGEFQANARGLETTFTPTVVGAGAFFNNVEAWLSGELFTSVPALVGLGVGYLLLWAFLLRRHPASGWRRTDGCHPGRWWSNGGRYLPALPAAVAALGYLLRPRVRRRAAGS